METTKKGELAWKDRNRCAPHEFAAAKKKSPLSKLREVFIPSVDGTPQQDCDSDSTSHIARAYETSFLKRVQMPQ
jgi:hypothetical protein